MDRHLSPARVAELAEEADPGLLVLTHVYPPQSPSAVAEWVAARCGRQVVAATDGLRIRLDPVGPAVDPTRTPL
jgi:ribonuclease BN (tRNA processing enzyme)